MKEGSKKDEFKSRSVTFTSELFPNLSVARSRTSSGGRSICASIGGPDVDSPKMVLRFGEGQGEGDYVEKVRELARLLVEASDEPCLID